MTQQELELSVSNLTKVTGGVKQEILDIKEKLADSNIENLEYNLSFKLDSIKKTLIGQLAKYVTNDDVKSQYYSKLDIDNKLSSLNLLTIDDVENLVDDTYLTKDDLKNYVDKSYLDTYVTNCLKDYPTFDDVKSTYVTKEYVDGVVLKNNPDLSSYVTNTYLKDYLTTNYYSKKETDKLITNSTSGFLKKSELYNYISLSDYATIDWIDSNFAKKEDIQTDGVTKSELNNRFILESDVLKTSILNTIKNEKYSTVDYVDRRIGESFKQIDEIYIPSALEIVTSNFAKKDDIKNFITRSEFGKYLGDLVKNDEPISLDDYVKNDELKKYALKSDTTDFVKHGDFTTSITTLKTNIEKVSSSLKNYVTQVSLEQYVTVENLEEQLKDSDIVTKQFLNDKIEDLNLEQYVIDTTQFTTFDDLKNLKSYVDESLGNYALTRNIYTKSYIQKNYPTFDYLKDNFFTQEQANGRYVNKEDMSSYITYVKAYSDFLLKEDYRGIRDAMTLNDYYKSSPESFKLLLDNGKLSDGFYIIGNNVKIVKGGDVYSTELIGEDMYTQEQIDDKIKEVENRVISKYWKQDVGGNY